MTPTTTAVASETSRPRRLLAIFLVSLAGLLLEVGYTRIVSYKLWYYYTYLVIGLALLGIGSGGVFVAVSRRLQAASTERILALCSVLGAASIAIGYLVIARLPVNTVAIWDYGTRASFRNVGLLALICGVLFATFIAIGIIVATLLGRAREDVAKLYFADLVGAGLACLVAVWLIARLGPPAVVMLSAAVLTLVGIVAVVPRRSILLVVTAASTILLLIPVVHTDLLPDVRPEQTKHADGPGKVFSEWGPVFRVDAVQLEPQSALLLHDGNFGSAIYKWDGDIASLGRYDTDPRSLPFHVLRTPPEHELIIGSAGGNEILASLRFHAPDIEAVELNPVTISLLTDHFRDWTGNIPKRPGVHMHLGDGRSYLARSDTRYDLIWFVAPDSYAANNAASAGAFVLSESYLYTSEMIKESLHHLSDRGIMVVQFGELNVETNPNRTARYVTTARDALRKIGVEDPGKHIAVSAFLTDNSGDFSTVVVKRTPFAHKEVAGLLAGIAQTPRVASIYTPGQPVGTSTVAQIAGGTDAEAASAVARYPRDISAVTDDAPFFWHFSRFDHVLAHVFDPIKASDPEISIGERVLLLLLFLSALYAAVFLLLPFLAVRDRWRVLPAKGVSAVYFAALGLGFMFFEITMIQRLVLFLGYPTYSLTVTLAAILISTGIGALLSDRIANRSRLALPTLLGVLAGLTLFYEFALGGLTDGMLSFALAARVAVAFVVLFPLGLCLGMFMPLGLGVVRRLTDHGAEYVAWSWAVNGFFSVIGAVLTTILSMQFGFRTVQFLALAVYAVAVLAFTRLRAIARARVD
jgi:hypothetical protein